MKQKELTDIQKRIKKLKSTIVVKSDTYNEINAFTIAVDLVASIMVGLLIGIGLDKFFSSKPICLIVCLIMGILAAIKIIWQKIKMNK